MPPMLLGYDAGRDETFLEVRDVGTMDFQAATPRRSAAWCWREGWRAEVNAQQSIVMQPR